MIFFFLKKKRKNKARSDVHTALSKLGNHTCQIWQPEQFVFFLPFQPPGTLKILPSLPFHPFPSETSIFLILQFNSAFFIHQPVQWVCSHSSICWCFSSPERITMFSWVLATTTLARILPIISTTNSILLGFALLEMMVESTQDKSLISRKRYGNPGYRLLCSLKAMLLQQSAWTSLCTSWIPGIKLGSLCFPFFTTLIRRRSVNRKGCLKKHLLNTKKASIRKWLEWKVGGPLLKKLQTWQEWCCSKTGI